MKSIAFIGTVHCNQDEAFLSIDICLSGCKEGEEIQVDLSPVGAPTRETLMKAVPLLKESLARTKHPHTPWADNVREWIKEVEETEEKG